MPSIRESIDAVELPSSRSVSDSESRKIASHGLRVTEVSEPGSVADLFNERGGCGGEGRFGGAGEEHRRPLGSKSCFSGFAVSRV
jgi:hypothetical protein